MKRALVFLSIVALATGCGKKTSSKNFVVSGTITNNPGKYIYLEEIPVGTMQRIVVDSMALKADGKYSLEAEPREASVYNLRLDQNTYPMASVINDSKSITLNATFNKENKMFPENYEVKGSVSSQKLKDFMVSFNSKLQRIYEIDTKSDTIKNSGDTTGITSQTTRQQLAAEIRKDLDNALQQSDNPALSMMILGYYQSTANNPGFKLEGINNEEVSKIINDVAAKFPDHRGVASLKQMLDAEVAKSKGLIGQSAPEIVMPDVNGHEVRLSSFRGKFVLVDFWASWCGPCRLENPTVVAAYNKYKDKNFTILGVSLDKPGEKDNWMKAIMDDKLTWTQVSDLQFWQSPVVQLYGLEVIPFNVLVDPNGKIIAQALRGDALEAKLAEVLK